MLDVKNNVCHCMFFPEKVVSLPYLQKLPVRAKILNRMNFARRRYLEKLIGHRHNHLIKVINGPGGPQEQGLAQSGRTVGIH